MLMCLESKVRMVLSALRVVGTMDETLLVLVYVSWQCKFSPFPNTVPTWILNFYFYLFFRIQKYEETDETR